MDKNNLNSECEKITSEILTECNEFTPEEFTAKCMYKAYIEHIIEPQSKSDTMAQNFIDVIRQRGVVSIEGSNELNAAKTYAAGFREGMLFLMQVYDRVNSRKGANNND